MNPPPKLSRAELLSYLTELGAKLEKRHVEGHLYVVGGAAIAFSYGGDRSTRDIDGIASPQDAVFDAVRELTEERELNEEWLNDTAAAFLPDVRIDEGPVVLTVPGLTVRTAPAEVILAMKLLSARPQRDTEDVRYLMGLLDLQTKEQLTELFLKYYPHGELLERSMHFIGAIGSSAQSAPGPG